MKVKSSDSDKGMLIILSTTSCLIMLVSLFTVPLLSVLSLLIGLGGIASAHVYRLTRTPELARFVVAAYLAVAGSLINLAVGVLA